MFIHVILRGGVECMTFVTIFICGGLVGMYVHLKTMPCRGNDGHCLLRHELDAQTDSHMHKHSNIYVYSMYSLSRKRTFIYRLVSSSCLFNVAC